MTIQAERQRTKLSTSSPCLDLPQRWLWTVKEFQRAYDLGAFGFETRLELIEGEIIRKMPQNEPHTWAIRAVEEALRSAFLPGHDVRTQLPLVFGSRNKPEPDVAVVIGSFNDYKRKHPATAVLVVEVSDSTLALDRTTKAAVYARAGIEDYWIVNLPDGVLEVHRQPAAMTDQPLGHHYRSITRLVPTDIIAPLSLPDAAIAVRGLLP
jgi:Uma2 family endonuclease